MKKFGSFIFLLYICIVKEKAFIMMDYTELKRGDVIAMIMQEYDEIRIVIVDRVENSATGIHKLYTYAELETSSRMFESSLFLEKDEPIDEPVYSYNLNDCVIRYAEDEEKIDLYNAICKHFTEEYDKDWYNHFTDSSYFDVQDYLFDVFCITVEEYDNDLIYPDFINEIHQFIWDKLCEVMGVTDTDANKPEMVNKQEFIEKAKEWLEKTLYIHTEINEDKDWSETNPIDWVTSDYESVEEFINGFCKAMEE